MASLLLHRSQVVLHHHHHHHHQRPLLPLYRNLSIAHFRIPTSQRASTGYTGSVLLRYRPRPTITVCAGSVARSSTSSASTMGSSARNRGEIKVFDSVDDLSTSLAEYIAELSDAAIKERGVFSIALSGGSLINTMGKLCEPPYLKTVDWSRWHIFWADERVVPRNHADSNYKLAKDGLLSKVPVVPGQVYSINDALQADAAAEDYEFGLRQLVKTRTVDVSPTSDFPRFDLILLGMGPDGHVASLFPGHPLTHEKEKWITHITDSPKPPPERITFTFPVINSAANVAMVLTGENKADVLQKTFGEELPPGVLPVQMVNPTEGKLIWFLDKPAASKL